MAMSPVEFTPATQPELVRFLSDNANGAQKSICPVGGRTALDFGATVPTDVVVSLSELKRVVDYPARDMTITVEAGIRISELQAALAVEGQRLPIDIAQPQRATLGGAVVTNTSGPRRFGHGTFRDFVIGISAVDGEGRLFKAGGRVVKNVAGYDLCKLLVGSRGTLAVVTQVTLKLRPIAQSTALLWSSFSSFDQIERALQRLLLSDARPIAVEVLNPTAAKLISTAARHASDSLHPVLCIGVEGTQHEVQWQLGTLQREIGECGGTKMERIMDADAERLWTALAEFPTQADDPLTFQANLLPSQAMQFANRATELGVAVQVHAGNGIVVGQLPDEAATVDRTLSILNELRSIAHAARGNLIILHCDDEWKQNIPLSGDPEPSWGLMRRLKKQLDPRNLLNPGAFIDVVTPGKS